MLSGSCEETECFIHKLSERTEKGLRTLGNTTYKTVIEKSQYS